MKMNTFNNLKTITKDSEDFEIAVSTVGSSINDMNETSQEIDEVISKFDTLNYAMETIQKRLVTRIETLKRSVEDLKEFE
tara:strand:+ start:1663 stop:1902 length:240 start_codon:yes stop_codon:yes gene_type:complete